MTGALLASYTSHPTFGSPRSFNLDIRLISLESTHLSLGSMKLDSKGTRSEGHTVSHHFSDLDSMAAKCTSLSGWKVERKFVILDFFHVWRPFIVILTSQLSECYRQSFEGWPSSRPFNLVSHQMYLVGCSKIINHGLQ